MNQHLLRVARPVVEFEEVIAAVRHHGGRVGWLELGEVAAAPLPEALETAAGYGVLRAVAVGGGRTVAVKPMRGPAVLADVLREHFRGCVLVLVHGDSDSDVTSPRLEPREGGWTVLQETGEKHLTTEELVAALRKPRPWKIADQEKR